MPPSYCPCPRPILKRRSPSPQPEAGPLPTSPRDESTQLLNIDPSVLQPLVHFAPPSGLIRTFDAYSPSIYDRSPIVVTPNKCSLPERGCPGKTYVPGDESERLSLAMAFATATRHRSGKKSRDASPAGRHLHPRAVRVHLPRDNDNDDEDDELTPKPTPLADSHPLPPLIPDVSSSSDSEESDGFVSPPMESSGMAYAPLLKATSLTSSSATPARTPGLSIPIPPPDLSAAFSSMYLSPKSTPTSPLSFRSRFVSYSSRSSSPVRSMSPASSPRSHSPCRDATSLPRRRHPHSKTKRVRGCASSSPNELEGHYKTLSEQNILSAYAPNVLDEGCLGGF